MPALRNRRSRRIEAAASIAAAGAVCFALGALAFVSLAMLSQASAFAASPASPVANATRAPVKWVDATGRVHYTDRQPTPDAMGRSASAQTIPARPPAPTIGDPTLPWALRSAAARYPVTLYTTTGCDPCGLARDHLAQRGVPYTEKRVEDAGDLKAFHALGFDKPLFPSLSIGPEKLTGFESIGWDRALDATGYPKTSMLPARRDPRTVAPMREEARRTAGAADADTEGVAGSDAGGAKSGDVDTLLSPASFRTGPNPIRF